MSATSNRTTTSHNHHHHIPNTTIPKQPENSLPNYKQQTHQQHQSPDITKEEFECISEALKKEEFRKLFLDYIEEIQDPENRKIYEEEIKQIEAERGVDVVFIHPQAGFVIKTSQNGSQKCFINCAKSEHVAKPTNQICLDQKTGSRGLSWSIPMAQAPPRDDLDNKNKRCRVYDVVFHPDALYLAERNHSFHKCLVDTALDAVEREYKVNLDRINIKFPKLEFKGIARPTVIRKLADKPPAECNEPHPLEGIYPAKPSANAGIPKVLPLKTFDCNNQTAKKSYDYCTPKYTLKNRHDVDLTEYTHELDAKLHISMPRELVVDIELPLLNSSSECQLDVTEKSLFLLSDRVGAKYRLNIDLPFRVKDKEGTAKFDVDTRHLIITVPVIRPSVEKERQMHESLLHLNREDSGVESDVREELLSSNGESPVQEICSLDMQQTFNKASEETFSKATTAIEAENKENFLNADIEYQLPAKFDCNVLDNTMSWVLHVRNVQEDSLKIRRIDNTLHLKFISVGSGYYPLHYSFYIQLSPKEKLAKILEADAEAWENNVILNLHLNTSAEGIFSYLAGTDSVNLQEYVIQEKFRVAHKSRQRLKDQDRDQSCLDISIERSEYKKNMEIEIKSRKNELSTCNANNTTEDEDIHSAGTDTLTSQQQQKKVGKKQKRKNKKRRSLSESACDDIKAYQHQQEQQQQILIPSPIAEVNGNVHDENAADADADDDDEEDSSPHRTEKSLKSLHTTSMSMSVPSKKTSINNSVNSQLNLKARKQRSFSESRDSAGSSSYKGILKHYSRYGPRPSISDSCDSFDEYSSSTYSTSVDGMTGTFNSLRFAHSFSGIPEENVVGLSESCKKTVRFSEVIKKQVFRTDSSILGQRKKNQKRRNRKQRALQRRLSEGDSADYEDNRTMPSLPAPTNPYLKTKNDQEYVFKNGNSIKPEITDKKSSNKIRARLESESSSDVDNHKNAMMFEMDM